MALGLGLALKSQGKTEEAFDAFYKSVWDGNMQDKGFYQLACIAAGKGSYHEALDYLEKQVIVHHGFIRIWRKPQDICSFSIQSGAAVAKRQLDIVVVVPPEQRPEGTGIGTDHSPHCVP